MNTGVEFLVIRTNTSSLWHAKMTGSYLASFEYSQKSR